MIWLAEIFAALALIGMAQALAGWALVRRFAAQPRPEPARWPAVSVLKPLHGDEPLLEDALASLCAQNYPAFQVVFGVRDAGDPALAVVARLRARFPACDIAVVVDATPHGRNRKVENLINMFSAARHDVLVIADSDVHAGEQYLRRLVAALQAPRVGLVTTPYVGLPARRRLPALLGASGITHFFLPGALLARAMGRRDCLGATMALRRETLARIGGLDALVDHLADDNKLGHLVGAQGLDVALAATVPATTVGEESLGALFRHELRWARTVRSVQPAGYAFSFLTQAIPLGLLAALISELSSPGLALLALAIVVRIMLHYAVRSAFGIRGVAAPWLVPVRDLLGFAVWIGSFFGRDVHWREQTFLLEADGQLAMKG